MKKIKNKIVVLAAVCFGMAFETGIVATANEVIKTAYVEDGVVYTDTDMTEAVNELYVSNDGTLYTDAEMTVAVPHKTDFEVNENGETYGNCLDVIYPEDEPDLIFATGDNGVEGYVRKTELDDDEMAKCETPEEAVRIQKEREENGNPPRVINVYESDGVTVIDTFTIGTD